LVSLVEQLQELQLSCCGSGGRWLSENGVQEIDVLTSCY